MIQQEEVFMRTEQRDGMRIQWQVPIKITDGTIIRADLFLPAEEGIYPTILSYGPYAKGQSFQEAYAGQWQRMVEDFPQIHEGSSNKYQCWELIDPERWVPGGYAVLRVDSRGAGWSEGVQDLWSIQEIHDFYECIEWAAKQSWSNGSIGLHGISYYAANQWLVAAMQPPSLKAIIPWEGTSDLYRELYYHGGIRCTFLDSWLPRQLPMQYGYGDRARKNPLTGESVAGPVTLTDEELLRNRVNKTEEIKAHALFDEYHQKTAVDWSKVTVPIFSSGNWGGQGLHLRGNIEGFIQAASAHKWLEVHGLEHWTHFYSPYGLDLQKRFFDFFLKGDDNGWDREPKVRLQIRHIGNKFVERTEDAWPIPRTEWTRYYLDSLNLSLKQTPASILGEASYKASEEGLVFFTSPIEKETEITGPLAAKLFISSLTQDADIFLVLSVYSPAGEEVVFRGAMDAHTPIAQGWLRASHRKLDEKQSLPYRPYHTHTEVQPLVPGEIYELDVEIWPTSIVVPAGYRLGLQVRGKDYEYQGGIDESSRQFHRYPSRGCGPFLHADPDDRPVSVYGEEVTIYTGGGRDSYLLLPIIPEK
jgi:predicted acyl esterase